MNAWDRFIRTLMGRRWLAFPVALVIAVGGGLLIPGIPFTSDVTEYLPKDSPRVATWLALSRRFDAFNALVVGLEEPAAPLTAEGLTRLKRITERLGALKSSGVLLARSVANVDSIREGEDGSLETELLIPQVPTDGEGLAALSRRITDDPQVSGALISRDQIGYVLLVRTDPRQDTAVTAALIQRVVEEERGPLRAFYFGAPFFSAVITSKVYAQLFWLVPAFALVLIGVLAGLVRSPKVIAVVLGSAAVALLAWLSLVRALGVGLTQTSLTALLVLLVVAVAAYARGLEERLASTDPGANPFSLRIVGVLAAVGLSCLALTRATIDYLASFGLDLAIGAVAVMGVGVLVFAPLAAFISPGPREPAGPRRAASVWVGLALATFAIAVAGVTASRARFHLSPQTMFAEHDEVGQALSFFDRRFGGNDFIQLDFKGDLRSPAVAARLLRLTDLLEGGDAFPDVRSVAQVLGFLNHGFAGTYCIPTKRDSLANLWFFLEGSSDVRNLVSTGRDEAMVLIRIPSKPAAPMSELVARVEAAFAASEKTGPESARLRLLAIGRKFRQPSVPGRVEAVLAALAAPISDPDRRALDEQVQSSVRAWLLSPDSPYQPTQDAWARLAAAMSVSEAERPARLTEVASSLPGLDEGLAGKLVDSIVTRERDLWRNARASALAEGLWSKEGEVPEAFKQRALGVLVEALDAQADAGDAATLVVSGLPVESALVEHDLLQGLWRAIATLWVLGGLLLLLVTRAARQVTRALIEAGVATALMVAVCGTLGYGIDSGSAATCLIPPLAALFASGRVGAGGDERRFHWLPAAFLAALGATALTLLLLGVLPVSRIGLGMAVGCGAVTLVNRLSVRFSKAIGSRRHV